MVTDEDNGECCGNTEKGVHTQPRRGFLEETNPSWNLKGEIGGGGGKSENEEGRKQH